jgi:hypothetical protein
LKKRQIIMLVVAVILVSLAACSQAPATKFTTVAATDNVTGLPTQTGVTPSENITEPATETSAAPSANATDFRLNNSLVTTASPDEFVKVTAPLTLDGTEPGTQIPWGSTVYHWANGITEVYGPDGKRLFIAKDAEAVEWSHPSGPNDSGISPATSILQVPNGSHIDRADVAGADNAITVSANGSAILTVLTMPEDFPFVP